MGGEILRQHPRVTADLLVQVIGSGRSVIARAVDLSMEGLKLLDVGLDDVGDMTQVAIGLPGQSTWRTACRVARREKGVVGLQFVALDWDQLLSIARYVSPRL